MFNPPLAFLVGVKNGGISTADFVSNASRKVHNKFFSIPGQKIASSKVKAAELNSVPSDVFLHFRRAGHSIGGVNDQGTTTRVDTYHHHLTGSVLDGKKEIQWIERYDFK